ncbi:MAG: RNA polymerase sporulation sigma factor SigK [Lachnospiraceae bacterium]
MEPLDKEEENKYFRQMKNGDLVARNILIERNMRLVAHIAKKYQNSEDEMDDLISIGTFGLIKAIMTFDDKKGSKLATYSARCIENELLMYMRTKKKSSRDVSLYEQIGTDKEGNHLRLMDILDSGQRDLSYHAEVGEAVEKLRRNMKDVLNEREQWIIIRRYGLDGNEPCTQMEVAKELKISRSYVSRIEKKALHKLFELLEGKENRMAL